MNYPLKKNGNTYTACHYIVHQKRDFGKNAKPPDNNKKKMLKPDL